MINIFYNGREINILERIPRILEKIKSIEHIIIINYPGEKYIKNKIIFKKVKVYKWNIFLNIKPEIIKFSRFDFEKELAIFIFEWPQLENLSVFVIEVEELYCSTKKNTNYTVISKRMTMYFILQLVDG